MRPDDFVPWGLSTTTLVTLGRSLRPQVLRGGEDLGDHHQCPSLTTRIWRSEDVKRLEDGIYIRNCLFSFILTSQKIHLQLFSS